MIATLVCWLIIAWLTAAQRLKGLLIERPTKTIHGHSLGLELHAIRVSCQSLSLLVFLDLFLVDLLSLLHHNMMHVTFSSWLVFDLENGSLTVDIILLISRRTLVILVCEVATRLLVIFPEQTAPLIFNLEELTVVPI